MTVLVTGATGFVGSAVARALLRRGDAVRALARTSGDRRNLRGLDIEIIEGDLRDPASLARAVRGCTTLYHVAADYRLWAPRAADLYRTNVEGTVALMHAARSAGITRIVYTSSVATLGLHPDRSPASETTPVSLADMIGHYKRSKFLAEAAVSELVTRERMPIVIVNPSTPIGPCDVKPTPTGRVVLDAARGRMPAYVDTGLNVAHVDDVAQGHLLAYERGRIGERYILGGENLTLREILNEVAALTGTRPPRVRLPHAAVLPIAYLAEVWARATGGAPRTTVDGVRMARKHMFFTSAKAERELGYQHRPAVAALRDAVAWFDAHAYD